MEKTGDENINPVIARKGGVENEPSHKAFRRKKYFVAKKFQLRYIALILAFMLMGAIVTGYTIYYNSWVLLGEKLANVYPQGRLMAIFRSVNIRVAVSLVAVSILCVIISVFASHKIAGPVYRLITFLDSVTAGNYSQRVRLRKGDELKDLAAAVNRLVEKLDKEKKKR